MTEVNNAASAGTNASRYKEMLQEYEDQDVILILYVHSSSTVGKKYYVKFVIRILPPGTPPVAGSLPRDNAWKAAATRG